MWPFGKKGLEQDIKMFKSYTPMDAMIYLHATAPHRMGEIDPNSVWPFFIKLIEPPFQNWVIEFTGIDETTSAWESVIDSMPKEITDKQLKKLQPLLKVLLSRIINDIMSTAIEEAKKVIIAEEKTK